MFQAGVISELYALPEPLKHSSCSTSSVTIEGYLDKLPSGKKKSTFWNAWKRRYFRAKDGFLYCYQVRKLALKIANFKYTEPFHIFNFRITKLRRQASHYN
jgi:hypothetical protein